MIIQRLVTTPSNFIQQPFRMTLKRSRVARIIRRLPVHSRAISSSPLPRADLYRSNVDAEPLHRYTLGGYHPVKLGSLLQDGRYEIMHKLGWGGYATVWAARDRRDDINVALKISVAKRTSGKDSQECRTMKTLTGIGTNAHLMDMLDVFELDGPNGLHECLVLELIGPSVTDFIEARFEDGRLPGQLAKSIAQQALRGLDALHGQKIGHGDLHVRNLAIKIPCLTDMPEGALSELLGEPEIGAVCRTDGQILEPCMPESIVRPASYQKEYLQSIREIKIVDFGESFLPTDIPPRTLHTPLPVRAPEVLFRRDKLDYRVDLWSMGCMLFELFVGQPPFDTLMMTPEILAQQMKEMASDDLPDRWRGLINCCPDTDTTCPSLQEWLEEMYFDGVRKSDLTRDDMKELGRLIGRLLYFEPSKRASAREILDDAWFGTNE